MHKKHKIQKYNQTAQLLANVTLKTSYKLVSHCSRQAHEPKTDFLTYLNVWLHAIRQK